MQYPEKGESQHPQGKFLPRAKESHRVIGEDDPVNKIDPSGNSVLETAIGKEKDKLTAALNLRIAVEDLSVSPMGEKFFKFHESVGGIPNLTIYKDTKGLQTIGYGHLLVGNEANDFKNGIKSDDAEKILQNDIGNAESDFKGLVSGATFYQYEYDSMVYFTFTVGLGHGHSGWKIWGLFQDASNFSRIPGLLTTSYAKGVADHRQDEADLFQKGVYLIHGKPLP